MPPSRDTFNWGMGALAPHADPLFWRPCLHSCQTAVALRAVLLAPFAPAKAAKKQPLGNITESAAAFVAELMALMPVTRLMSVTELILLMGLDGSAKPLISSHSLRRNPRRNPSGTRATQGLQPFKKILLFFTVFCCFFRHKTAQ